MAAQKKAGVDVLDALSASEGLGLLRALLEAHPELKEEARGIARGRLELVDRRDIAARVVAAFEALTVEALWSRSSRHAHGYVEPGAAAWELLEEVLGPLTQETLRLLALGLEDPAQRQCEGVLLGLHEVLLEDPDHEILRYAPDFLGEAAGAAAAAWMGALGGPRQLDEDFLVEELYEWVDLVRRIEEHIATRAAPKRR